MINQGVCRGCMTRQTSLTPRGARYPQGRMPMDYWHPRNERNAVPGVRERAGSYDRLC